MFPCQVKRPWEEGLACTVLEAAQLVAKVDYNYRSTVPLNARITASNAFSGSILSPCEVLKAFTRILWAISAE